MSRFIVYCLPGIGDLLPSVSPDACSVILLLRTVAGASGSSSAIVSLRPTTHPTPIVHLLDAANTKLNGLPEVLEWILKAYPQDMGPLGRHYLAWTRSNLTPPLLFLLFGTASYADTTRRVIASGNGYWSSVATSRGSALRTANAFGVSSEALARKTLAVYLSDLRGTVLVGRGGLGCGAIVDAIVGGQLLVLMRLPWMHAPKDDEVLRGFVDRVAIVGDWAHQWPPLEAFDTTGRWAAVAAGVAVSVGYFVLMNLDIFLPEEQQAVEAAPAPAAPPAN